MFVFVRVPEVLPYFWSRRARQGLGRALWKG